MLITPSQIVFFVPTVFCLFSKTTRLDAEVFKIIFYLFCDMITLRKEIFISFKSLKNKYVHNYAMCVSNLSCELFAELELSLNFDMMRLNGLETAI